MILRFAADVESEALNPARSLLHFRRAGARTTARPTRPTPEPHMNRGDFSAGLQVRLESGGPVMTVVSQTKSGLWTCTFTQNGRAMQDDFDPALLVAA